MLNPYDTSLPSHLRSLKEEIEGYAREYGLDFYETIFEVIDADDLNEIAAYGGFPTRYPHWSFGMAYEELKKSYDYGLSKIYEMVINNDPCYAYLMRCNHVVDQKLVMAHVYGHCDFFKNNAYFAHTNRKMMDEMANHGARIRRYAEKYGEDEVESFLDRCMTIDDLIDIHSTAIKRRGDSTRFDFSPEPEGNDDIRATRFKSKDYMDRFINPEEVLRAEEEERRKAKEQMERSFPERPEKDVLLFLIEYSRTLKPWQRDVLSIIRDEAYYFMPQAQTKILNEGWACIHGDEFVYTTAGLLPMRELVEHHRTAQVSDGQQLRAVYDRARFANRETVWLRTRRGLELEGSTTHQLLLPGGTWRRMDEIRVGDRVEIAHGMNLWAQNPVTLDWKPQTRLTLDKVAVQAGASVWTRIRHKKGKRTKDTAQLLPAYEADRATRGLMQNHRCAWKIPTLVDESLAAFLGYLIGDGHISAGKRTINMVSADEPPIEHFEALAQELFGIVPRRRWEGTRWRVSFSSKNIQQFLQHLGLKTGCCAREKCVPDVILRSPKPVVAAFLRALYDCDGYAGDQGVILSTASTQMSKVVQLLLLNFGILATRRLNQDGCWHVHTTGKSAAVFLQEIGFRLQRKQEALQSYVQDRQFKRQEWTDEVVSLERRRGDVYDVSVEQTHRYAAGGFINHNSYWHSTIMTTKALWPQELIDYADHHSGTMAMHGPRLNPYKLGIELLRDIEMRWNTGRFGKEYEECDDLEKKKNWDLHLGLGRKKIFEVRRIHNDITFIDTFLTPEFCVENKLFTFAWQEQAGQWYIDSRDFQKIKQRLLFSLTNFGKPWIVVVDGNYRNRGELLLRHEYNGVELKLDQAADTLANVQYLWGRPVHLQTIVDDKPTTLSFDGADHSIRTGGETDDPRKHTPGKTR